MGIAMNEDLREKRIRIFENTMYLIETERTLMDAVLHSKKYQKIIAESAGIPVLPSKNEVPAKVVVSKKRSLEAARQYRGRKTCVLNFASAINPGGGVVKGSNAQEEAICRCSTLYACISDRNVAGSFHSRHRQELRDGRLTSLYNDDCIYTPGVIVFKTDTAEPELMPETAWYGIDVISCAAPNLGRGNYMDRAASIGREELMALHKKRVSRVLDIAKSNGAEIIVLGAFGCGAFRNPPETVARAMLDAVRSHLQDFSVIEFAIYCPPYNTKNYDVFRETLAPVCG